MVQWLHARAFEPERARARTGRGADRMPSQPPASSRHGGSPRRKVERAEGKAISSGAVRSGRGSHTSLGGAADGGQGGGAGGGPGGPVQPAAAQERLVRRLLRPAVHRERRASSRRAPRLLLASHPHSAASPGVVGGATALIAAPAIGAQQEGAVGFLKGLGAGATAPRGNSLSRAPHPPPQASPAPSSCPWRAPPSAWFSSGGACSRCATRLCARAHIPLRARAAASPTPPRL